MPALDRPAPALALLLALAIPALVAACGASSTRVSSASHEAAASARFVGDDDGNADGRRGSVDADDWLVKEYGGQASARDRRAIAETIRGFYADAVGGYGNDACALVVAGLARSARIGQVGESYAPSPNAPLLVGKSCGYILSLLFAESHAQLSEEARTLALTAIRVKGSLALATLAFGDTPERQFALRREGRAWRLLTLFDTELP